MYNKALHEALSKLNGQVGAIPWQLKILTDLLTSQLAADPENIERKAMLEEIQDLSMRMAKMQDWTLAKCKAQEEERAALPPVPLEVQLQEAEKKLKEAEERVSQSRYKMQGMNDNDVLIEQGEANEAWRDANRLVNQLLNAIRDRDAAASK